MDITREPVTSKKPTFKSAITSARFLRSVCHFGTLYTKRLSMEFKK